jgi:hypothetical protein
LLLPEEEVGAVEVGVAEGGLPDRQVVVEPNT